jgi:putative membrane protein
MHKPAKRTTLRGTAALAGALLLCPGFAGAQAAGGASGGGASGGGASGAQQQPQQSSPGQQEMQNQSAGMNSQMNNMQAQEQDTLFVKDAMQGNVAEIQLGQLALQKSSNPQVKQFAQRMIDDHGKMNDSLKPVAQQLGVSAPNKVDKKAQNTINKLSALSGPQFDQAYAADMVNDHKHDLQSFKDEADTTQNPTMKNIATQGAQVISAHLQMAQQLQSQQPASAGQ